MNLLERLRNEIYEYFPDMSLDMQTQIDQLLEKIDETRPEVTIDPVFKQQLWKKLEVLHMIDTQRRSPQWLLQRYRKSILLVPSLLLIWLIGAWWVNFPRYEGQLLLPISVQLERSELERAEDSQWPANDEVVWELVDQDAPSDLAKETDHVQQPNADLPTETNTIDTLPQELLDESDLSAQAQEIALPPEPEGDDTVVNQLVDEPLEERAVKHTTKWLDSWSPQDIEEDLSLPEEWDTFGDGDGDSEQWDLGWDMIDTLDDDEALPPVQADGVYWEDIYILTYQEQQRFNQINQQRLTWIDPWLTPDEQRSVIYLHATYIAALDWAEERTQEEKDTRAQNFVTDMTPYFNYEVSGVKQQVNNHLLDTYFLPWPQEEE